jgi:hypothetical protein
MNIRRLSIPVFFMLLNCAANTSASDKVEKGSETAPPAVQTAAPSPESGDDRGLGTWEGSGSLHDVSGAELGRFTVQVVRTATSERTTRADGTVTLPDGTKRTFWQELQYGTSGFRVTSNNGAGGGRCFSNAVCQTYEERDGRAFATTLVKDGPSTLRLLTTELDGGKAVRMTEQTLHRK